jgi:two-component system response regulator HydG
MILSRPISVLIVEDDPELLEFARTVLTQAGMHAVAAASAAASLAALAGPDDFDLLFVDFVLPGMCADELIVLAQRTHPNLRVICTSGFDRDCLPMTVGLPPIATFLAKPYRIDRLIESVHAALMAHGPG